MGWRPDFFVPVREASRRLQEADGALSRAQHAMIRLYVPALNRCQHCTADHAYRMEQRGAWQAEIAAALRDGYLDRAPIAPPERLLLEFVGTLTRHAYRITDEQVQGLREIGWTDPQIAEAVYVGAFMNMITRITDAFGIGQDA